MTKQVQCPYCNENNDIHVVDVYVDIDGWDFKHKCQHCEKTFLVVVDVEVTLEGDKLDCQNGGKHNYLMQVKHTFTDGSIANYKRCICGTDDRKTGVNHVK